MPPSFKTGGIYKRPPDAMSYIRQGEVRGTIAFYEGWWGVRIVCRITGLKKGYAFIGVGEKTALPLAVDENGAVSAALFDGKIRLNKLKGKSLLLSNNDLTLCCGRVK